MQIPNRKFDNDLQVMNQVKILSSRLEDSEFSLENNLNNTEY